METTQEVVSANQMVCECGNCGHVCPQSALRDIKDYHMRVDVDGPEPDGECPQCGALSYQVKETAVPMRAVRIKLVAMVCKEYSETLSVPVTMTDAQLDQLVNARYQVVDGGAFEDDPEYWERGRCSFESAESMDDVSGIVSIVDGRITVLELPMPAPSSAGSGANHSGVVITEVRLGDPKAKHLYRIGVTKQGVHSYIQVDADTRVQAGRIAKEEGYEVGDVNMVG